MRENLNKTQEKFMEIFVKKLIFELRYLERLKAGKAKPKRNYDDKKGVDALRGIEPLRDFLGRLAEAAQQYARKLAIQNKKQIDHLEGSAGMDAFVMRHIKVIFEGFKETSARRGWTLEQVLNPPLTENISGAPEQARSSVVAADVQDAEEAPLPVISDAPLVLASEDHLGLFWSRVEVSLEEWKNHLAVSDEQSLFYLFMGIWKKLLKDLREALGPEPLPFSVKILGLSGERLFPENLIEYAFDWVAGQNPQDTLAMEAYLGRFNELLLKAVEKLNHLETSVSCKFYMGFASRSLVHATLPREKQEQYYRELAEQSEMLVDRLSLVDYAYAHTAFSSGGAVLEEHPVPPFQILELSKWIHELSQALPMRDLNRMAFYLSRVWSMGERLLRGLKDSGRRYGFLRYQMEVSLDELYHAWWEKERSRDSSSLLACVKQQIADWDHYWKQLEQALAEKHQDLAYPMLEAS